tara:strand:- start:431 stop:889 length:459 start_codon:yes stop_codon:yes gene_type:complete
MKKKAIFPGSFDPYTKGHHSIILNSLKIFDEVIIAIGTNELKNTFYPLNIRLESIRNLYKNEPKIDVQSYNGLTVNFCKKMKINTIIRGIRNIQDFEYEKQIQEINKSLDSEINSFFIISESEYAHISSSFLKDILKNGGDIKDFLPKNYNL